MFVHSIQVSNEKHIAPKPIISELHNEIPIEFQGIMADSNKWIELACDTATASVKQGGGPFGAVILQIDRDSEAILRYWIASNAVVEQNDPTAHAEVRVIRSACKELGVFNLGKILKDESYLSQPGERSYCVVYSSCEPCPMCYSAISWARIPALYFAADRFDAAQPGVDFSDLEFYKEFEKPYFQRKLEVCKCVTPNATEAFKIWKESEHTNY